MILVDTSVWIDYFKGHETSTVSRLLQAIENDEDLCVCGLIVTEILQGIRSKTEHRRVKTVLREFIFLPMADRCYYRASDIYRSARSKGETIRNSIDCLIAACAIEHKAPLLHSDKDYEVIARFSKLKIARVN